MKYYRRKRTILALGIALFTATSLSAQEGMSLEEAIGRALEHNISLRRQELAVKGAKRSADTAWNTLYPALTTNIGSSLANKEGSNWSLSAGFNASLTLSPAIVDGIKAARLAWEAGTISLDRARRDIERAIRKLWYQLITLDEQLSVLASSEANAKLSLERTQAKQAAGLASEIDLLNARIMAENARVKLESAKSSRELALARFRDLIGLDAGDRTAFALGGLDAPAEGETVELPPLETITPPTLKSLYKSIESAKTARDLSFKQSFLPRLSLSWNWAPATSLVDGVDLLNADSWNDTGRFSVSIGMSLDPLIPGSAARMSLAKSDDSLADLALQVESEQQALALTVQQLLDSITDKKATLAALEATADLAQRSYELTGEAYRRGTRDLLALESAEQSLREARLQVINQRRSILEDLLDLEYSCGLPFGSLGGRQ